MKNKKFPTILGIIFLMIILFFGVYLSNQRTTLPSGASTSCEPINPQVTNLTYSSFDFSFTTSSFCTATLTINNKIYQDISISTTTHYFKVSNLSPNTSYKFSIISGSTTYSRPEYSLTTTVKPSSSVPSSNLAWGRILDSNQSPVSGAIIYLTIPGSQALSAFSNSAGNWNISLATSFNEQKTDWFKYSTVVEEDIIVYSPDGQLTQLTNRTDNNDPVPDIIIGQNYFSQAPNKHNTDVLIDSVSTQKSQANLSITSPKESETISTFRPQIFGQGPAYETFQLDLDGDVSNITVGTNNAWSYNPSRDLSPGPHKLTLTYQGNIISRNFSISETSDYLSFSATPSATLIPTQSLLPTQTSTPSPSPNPTQISTPSPSPKATQVPTIISAEPSTTSSLYKSGNTIPTLFIVILSTLLFGVSFYYSH